MTAAHFLVSAAMRFANSVDDPGDPETASPARRAFAVGSASAALTPCSDSRRYRRAYSWEPRCRTSHSLRTPARIRRRTEPRARTRDVPQWSPPTGEACPSDNNREPAPQCSGPDPKATSLGEVDTGSPPTTCSSVRRGGSSGRQRETAAEPARLTTRRWAARPGLSQGPPRSRRRARPCS
jgi:hypothetical protein